MTLENLLEEVERLPITDKWRLMRHLLDGLEWKKRNKRPRSKKTGTTS